MIRKNPWTVIQAVSEVKRFGRYSSHSRTGTLSRRRVCPWVRLLMKINQMLKNIRKPPDACSHEELFPVRWEPRRGELD